MKKIFTTFAAVLCFGFCMAINYTSAANIKALATEDSIPSVTVLGSKADTIGSYAIFWAGNDSVSEYYDVQLATCDTVAYTYVPFCELAAKTNAFGITGYPGYFAVSTRSVVKYGDNYTTIGNYGAKEDVVAAWENAWKASVAADSICLNPGAYIVFVAGMSSKGEVTESSDYEIIVVKDAEQGVEIVTDKFPAVKTVENGKVVILKNGAKYDVMGNRIQ